MQTKAKKHVLSFLSSSSSKIATKISNQRCQLNQCFFPCNSYTTNALIYFHISHIITVLNCIIVQVCHFVIILTVTMRIYIHRMNSAANFQMFCRISIQYLNIHMKIYSIIRVCCRFSVVYPDFYTKRKKTYAK